MVLHNVAQRADRIVELAAVLDADVLGHGDVDFGDAVPVPQRGQRLVGEPQELKLDYGPLA